MKLRVRNPLRDEWLELETEQVTDAIGTHHLLHLDEVEEVLSSWQDAPIQPGEDVVRHGSVTYHGDVVVALYMEGELSVEHWVPLERGTLLVSGPRYPWEDGPFRDWDQE